MDRRPAYSTCKDIDLKSLLQLSCAVHRQSLMIAYRSVNVLLSQSVDKLDVIEAIASSFLLPRTRFARRTVGEGFAIPLCRVYAFIA